MQCCSVSSPPGLEDLDSWVPAKVELPSTWAPRYVPQQVEEPPMLQDPLRGQFSSSEWADKVNSVAPYLNPQGLRRALSILDQATQNMQRAKAMEQVSTNLAGNGYAPYLQCTAAFAMMQVQVQQQQQRLLSDLQQLPFDPASTRERGPPHSTLASAGALLSATAQAASGCPGAGAKTPTAAPVQVAAPIAEVQGSAEKASERSKSPPASKKVQTLSTSLQLLSSEDPDCLFIVRRINKLGFKAVRTLKRHFSAHGPVIKVLLAHSTVRQHGDPSCHARRRPSSLGFVQMGSAEAAAKAIAAGAEQEVDGVFIRVQRFERQRAGDAEDDEEEEVSRWGSKRTVDTDSPEIDGKWERGLSEVSTTGSTSSVSGMGAAGAGSEKSV